MYGAESVYKNLTLAMQRKTNKAIELKEKRDSEVQASRLRFAVAGMFLAYVCFNGSSYVNLAAALFGGFAELSSSNATNSFLVTTFNIFMFGGAVVSLTYLYLHSKKVSKIQTKYNNLRKDIIDSLEHEFCTHSTACCCKDEYIKLMDTYSIDVVFK